MLDNIKLYLEGRDDIINNDVAMSVFIHAGRNEDGPMLHVAVGPTRVEMVGDYVAITDEDGRGIAFSRKSISAMIKRLEEALP